MRSVVRLLYALALALPWAATPVLADVPTEMSVQGRLTNGAGAPVPAGIKLFTFKIYDAPAGGIEIWPGGPGETQALSTDANGLWNAGVGTLIPLTEAVFQNPVRWLEVTIDDGVNPIETLPRIELRTNPYTYRAATSQQADSLAGNSLSDLGDMFVDEPGDTMSGPLGNVWTQKNLGTSIFAHNSNDGWLNYWNDFTGTWGLSGEASGDNGLWNVGVAGSALGNNNTNDANYGVAAYANGAGSVNIGVRGITGLSGTSNYSGYFSGGDFIVDFSQTPGTGGVMLPTDAIDQTEILDEPGVAFGSSTVGTLLTASITPQDFATATLTLPAPGYVVVQGTVTFRFTGTLTTNFTWMQIDTAAGGTGAAGAFIYVGAYAHAGASNEYETGSSTKVYNLSAGTYTFRVEGNAWAGNIAGAADYLFLSQITATYYPRSYGPVASAVATAGDFERAELVSATDPQTGDATSYYSVDLRELELRAARTQLEAERAKRELLEAKTSALHKSNSASTVVKEGANQ